MEIIMEELFTNLTKLYIDKCNIKQLPKLQVLIVEDIYEEYLKSELDEWRKSEIKRQKDIISGNNGLTIYPSNNRDYFIILISKEEIEKSQENNLLMICTLWHELTHVIDYQNFANTFNNGNFENIEKVENYMGFYFWTEYNAKKISYKLYKDFFWEDKSNSEESLEYIRNTELEFQNENLRQQLLSYEHNLTQQIYYIIHYLARYSIWEELDPDYYKNGEQFPYWLGITSNNILNLYIYMKELNCFDKAKDNFGKLVEKINALNKKVD